MRKVVSITLAFLIVLLSCNVFAMSGLDKVWCDQTDVVENINGVPYAFLTHDAVYGLNFYGARQWGGVDLLVWNGTTSKWDVTSISTNAYKALVPDGQLQHNIYGIRPGGGQSSGIDRIYENGEAYATEVINTNSYLAIAQDGSAQKSIFASREEGGLERIFYSSNSWLTDTVNSNTYTALTCDATTNLYTYGARSGGGLDWVHWVSGTGWVTEEINSNRYTTLAADVSETKSIYGARTDGGLDWIYWNGSGWVTSVVNSKEYIVLVNDSRDSHKIYGICKKGGLDRIYFNGSAWITETISTSLYGALVCDTLGSNRLIYASYQHSVAGGLDKVWCDQTDVVENINAVPYIFLTHDAVYGLNFYGARQWGGVDLLVWNGTTSKWDITSISSNAYKALVPDGQLQHNIYGIRPGGGQSSGIDRIYENGAAYTTEVISTNSYLAIAQDGNAQKSIFASREEGGLERIFYSSNSWLADTINSNTYTALTCDATTNLYTYGARSGGGLDWVHWVSGTGWVTEEINSNRYTTLTADVSETKSIYGARTDGGLDWIYWNGSGWVTSVVNSKEYIVLVNDSRDSHKIYGICKKGGLDRIYFNGSAWTTETISTSLYGALACDRSGSNRIIYASYPYFTEPYHIVQPAVEPRRMLIGSPGDLPESNPNSRWMPDYGCDDYEAYSQIMTPDGWNSHAFIVNYWGGYGDIGSGDAESGYVAWDTDASGWTYYSNVDFPLNVNSAEEHSNGLTAEFLTLALANNAVAAANPGWKAVNAIGQPVYYTGQLLDWNSPYWYQNCLPLFDDFIRKWGNRFDSMIIWEPVITYYGTWTQQAYQNSGYKDFDQWKHDDQAKKYAELNDTLRKNGWRGSVIGGGWGAYEWEEEMWDGTIYDYNTRLQDNLEPFRRGDVQIIMPELLVDGNDSPHPYRRSDMHYVYRSLQYERSVYGDNIIPNFELSWSGSVMTPDQVLRWILEAYSAGYPSFSVVSKEKAYIDNFFDEETYRSQWRTVFNAVNELPYFGRPVTNYQFVVSAELERQLKNPNAWTILSGWAASPWEQGGERGVQTTVNVDPPVFLINVPSDNYTMRVNVLDDISGTVEVFANYWDGGTWKDYDFGDINLIDDDQFKSFDFTIPTSVFLNATDADPSAPGKQVGIQLWSTSGGNNSTVPMKIESVEFKKGATLIAKAELEIGNAWEWYVTDLNKLFKEVDRTVCGGSLINERITDLGADELYGNTGNSKQIVIVPEGYVKPEPVPGRDVTNITVGLEEDLTDLKTQVLNEISSGIQYEVSNKDSLVYANMSRDDNGREFLTVINHGSASGSIDIELDWANAYSLVNSSIISKNVTYSYTSNTLSVSLPAYGSIVFSNQN